MAEEGNYVELPFTTNEAEIEDEALAVLEAKWPGWVAEDGDLSVVMFEAGAPLAANAIRLAAQMPPAALIALGTKLLQTPYNEGTPATAMATFKVASAVGVKVIPAGSEVDIEGVAFQLVNAVMIPEGQTEGEGEVRSNDVGSFANGLSGAQWAGVTLPLFVSGMTLAAPTNHGQDQEDDTEYLNRISLELRRRAKSIITLLDYEIVALEQQGVGGAQAIGITGKPRNIFVFSRTPEGGTVSGAIKALLEAEYAKTRMVNAKVTLADPFYDKVGVTWRAMALPGVEPASLLAAGNGALSAALQPGAWGKPTAAQPGLSWVNNPIVHVNKLIQVLSALAGLDYVESLSLTASNVAMLAQPLATGAKIGVIHVGSYVSPELAKLSEALGTGGAITSLPIEALELPIPNGTTITLTEPGGFKQEWTLTAAAEPGDTTLSVAAQVPNHAYPAHETKVGGVSQKVANVPVVGQVYTITESMFPHNTQKFVVTAYNNATGEWTAEHLPGEGATEIWDEFPIGSIISGPVAGDLTMPGLAAQPEPGEINGTVDTPAT